MAVLRVLARVLSMVVYIKPLWERIKNVYKKNTKEKIWKDHVRKKVEPFKKEREKKRKKKKKEKKKKKKEEKE